MSELQRNWGQLRAQQSSRANVLEEVYVHNLRGIQDLRIRFPFSVSVLAGPNGCGKTSVLFALGCAYKVPGAGIRDFTPASLFPEFRPQTIQEARYTDAREAAEITFAYVSNDERVQMKWARSSGKWNRSFFGRPKGSQPIREVYLRTLSNLSNPSEVRSVLQVARQKFQSEEVDSSLIAFAQRILSFRYTKLSKLTSGARELLFAERELGSGGGDAARYSEFHMSAGERSVLRLSMRLSKLKSALVLIDEIEAGLHPYTQQALMLELERLALRNDLQIVVTTHSPVVIDSVPEEARVFLDRIDDRVIRKNPYRDVIQKALYGQSQDALKILCEDEEAEGLVRGFLDHFGPELDFLQHDIEVGRDTGKDEFLNHLETFGRFRQISDYLMILDGDGRDLVDKLTARAQGLGQAVNVLCLPSAQPPEVWAWRTIRNHISDYAPLLGLQEERLRADMQQIEDLYSAATDKASQIAKNKLSSLGDRCSRQPGGIMRLVGRQEASREAGESFEFGTQLLEAIRNWRSRRVQADW